MHRNANTGATSFRHYTGVLSLHAPSFLKDAGEYLLNNLHGADTVVPPVATKAPDPAVVPLQCFTFPFEVDMLVYSFNNTFTLNYEPN